MNLRQLKIFLTVCQEGSMSKAAKKLYMTQPSISQTIGELEQELNIKLFERINKHLYLTYPGEILREYSKRIISLLEEAENTLLDISNLKTGKLRVGASTTIGTYLIPKILSEFRKKYENTSIFFNIDNTEVIEKQILENSIDIGIVEGPIHSQDIIIEPFIEDELYLVCSKGHRWALKKVIEPWEIEEEELIIREKGSGTREVFETIMSANNLKYHIKHVLNNTEAIKKAVELNMGVSVLSKLAVSEELKKGTLVKIEIEGIKFKRMFNIIYHKDKYFSPAFKAFMEYLKSGRR
ncbi:selenium metabolism-associated LysR family transcriptional regulator [Caldanaerobacter subterraneus]|uniref:LysR family transcriptional regulator n=1 Tax=Caldanaerobacter subterraneus TaxID=911092 RepID=A0A7Y2L7R6_9THEO|nr:selenium metabolism-associated LysR family transcriptional regulator [Caldanaerobacter subterraneus]NNG65956.1 LysR family transcriptional regulator [Caldanaerobacter subterraneus]